MLRAAFATLLFTLHSLAWAQSGPWPNKPVRMIVPTGAGTPIDAVARAVAVKLQDKFGQSFIVDNKPGANQIVGMNACATSAPDGYTFCIANNNSWTINPLVFQKLSYDPAKQLTPVALLVWSVPVITASAQLGVKNYKETVELSIKQPDALSWGSTGVGSNSHFYLDALTKASGWKVAHVPYANPGQLVPAALSNTVQLYYGTIGSVKAHIDSGKLIPLMVPYPQRSKYLPNVPTYKELGLGDFDLIAWFGIVAPTGVSADVLKKMNEAANEIVQSPSFKTTVLEPQTLEPAGGNLAEIAAYLKSERESSAAMVKKAAIKLE